MSKKPIVKKDIKDYVKELHTKKKQKVEMLKADNEKRKFDLIDEYRNGPKKVEHEDSMTIVQIPQEDANN